MIVTRILDAVSARVKIQLASGRFRTYFALYSVGDDVKCFIRERDLLNPKIVL